MTSGLDLSIGAPEAPEVELGQGLEDELAPGQEHELEELLEDDDAGAAVEVSELQVRVALAAVGGLIGMALGDKAVPDHWRFTDDELNDLTPPVTRIVNRNKALARVVSNADPITAGIVLVRYALRNVDLSRKAKELHEQHEQHEQGAAGAQSRGTRPVGSDANSGGAPAYGAPAAYASPHAGARGDRP